MLNTTPNRRSASSYLPKSVPHAPKMPGAVGEYTPSKARPSATSNLFHNKGLEDDVVDNSILRSARGSKTLSAKSSKPRPSIQNAFGKATAKPGDAKVKEPMSNSTVRPPSSGAESLKAADTFSPPSGISHRIQSSIDKPSSTIDSSESLKTPKSSAALRESIARAKAAKRRVSATQNKGFAGTQAQAEITPDFNAVDTATILRKRISSARADGRLNIAALDLKFMPPEVMNMYSANLGDGAWYESVDLVRLVAADNEIEQFEDEIFPDDAPKSPDLDEDYQGNLFGGLETLDLHGNRLKALPMGLRRLERLTTLNVSKNKLENGCISTISQIKSLRELSLAQNDLDGALSSDLCHIKNLEVLDLHDNTISALPGNIQELSRLRKVNVAGNRLESFSVESFTVLPLVELDASRNRLSGALFPSTVESITRLKYLDVANNALTSISPNATVHFPSLQSLNVTDNRLTALPNVSGWTDLLSLTAAGNHLDSFPEGITELPQLKSLDLSRNDIKTLEERLGLMDNLTALRVANNPLRERKFLNMTTEEVKRELSSRLYPEEATNVEESNINTSFTNDSFRNVNNLSSKIWPITPDGTLDRSSTKLETVEAADLEAFVDSNKVSAVVLNHNYLHDIPQALALVGQTLTRLDVSHNKLVTTTCLPSELSLPSLASLDLSANALDSLSPILNNLAAPRLTEINISRNRLTSLLPLGNKFPSLKSLLASNNVISKLGIDDIRGLQVLDISGNELQHLEPKIGLLGADGLRTFVVGGNRFRVPRRDIVEKGTEAILAWLRNRIPDDDG